MRIFLVKDEPKIGQVLKKELPQGQYAVDLVVQGKEAQVMALSQPYDLLILDRMLPGVRDKIIICQEVRRRGLQMPILMLIAKTQINDRMPVVLRKGMKLGG